MRLRVFFSIAFIAALAACGGGGGPAPTPTNTSYRPHETGDTFTYTGAIDETFVRPPLSDGPIPSPNPTSSQTIVTTVAQTVKVTTDVALPGSSAAPIYTEYTTAETDSLAAPATTTQTTTNDFYDFAMSGTTTNVSLLASNATASSGVTTTTTYGTGNGLVDILPEVTGTLSPTNNAAVTTVESDPQGQTDTKTVASDGTYTEAISYPYPSTTAANAVANAVANADGSGTYSYPLLGPNFANSTFAVGAPTGGQIPITITYAAGLIPPADPTVLPTPTVVTRMAPVWYPQPLVLSAQTLVNRGKTPLASGCTVAAAYAKSASLLSNTKTSVDPVFGETDSLTISTYSEPGVGVVCMQLTDTLSQYYDLSQQSVRAIQTTTDGTPVQTTVTTESLSLTQATTVGLDAVTRRAGASAMRASETSFRSLLAKRRAQRRTAALQTLRAFTGSR